MWFKHFIITIVRKSVSILLQLYPALNYHRRPLHRLLYAAPGWRGFATAQDCSRIDRFINRTVNLGYLPAYCHTFNSLVDTAEDMVHSFVIRNSYHVLSPLFFPILTRRPGLRKRAHPLTLPLRDDKQCIPRVLYRALFSPVQS